MTVIPALSFIISSSIFIHECKKRRGIKRDPSSRELNTTITNNSLRFYSLFALFCCPMALLFTLITRIPTTITCSWLIYTTAALFWGCNKIFLTFYQIARLKYCFSRKDSQKYGYSNLLFRILTICGIIILAFGMCLLFIPQYRVYHVASYPPFCIISRTENYNLWLFPIYVPLFYLWDWFILALYIIKLVQFQRIRAKSDIVIKKVFFILLKILLLTIICEITGAFVLTIQYLRKESNIITTLILVPELIISSIIIFLMIEHNHGHYIKIIKTFNSSHLCFCCTSLIKDVINHEGHQASVGGALPGGVDMDCDTLQRDHHGDDRTKTKYDSTMISSNVGGIATISLKFPQIDTSNTNDVLGV